MLHEESYMVPSAARLALNLESLTVQHLRCFNCQRSLLPAMSTKNHLQNIIDSAIDFAIIATDLNGLVTDWNSGAERIMGWSREDMLGTSAERMFTVEDQASGRLREEMRLSIEHGCANDERWHVRIDGTRFWASGELMPLRNQEGVHRGYVKILRDRTRQREFDERLQESEAWSFEEVCRW